MPAKRKTGKVETTESVRKANKGEEAFRELMAEAERVDKENEEELINSPLRFSVLNGEPELEIGQRIQRAREEKGLTQGQLAELTKRADKDSKGLSRGVISLYELGTNRPGPKEIRLLCEVLRVSPSQLIYGDEDPFQGRLESARYRGWARSEPEFYAALTYCLYRLHHHQRLALMDIMLGLLRGWNKRFDHDLDAHAADTFLKMSDELRLLLAKRNRKT